MAFRDGRRQRKSRRDPQAYLGHASRRQDFCGQLPHAISRDRLYRQGAGRLSLGPTQLSTQFVNGTTMLFAPAERGRSFFLWLGLVFVAAPNPVLDRGRCLVVVAKISVRR